MLKRFRHSSIHRALTWLLLCVWLTLVGAAGVHHHPVSHPATQGSASAILSIAARQASGRSSRLVAAADNDDECGVCKWLCAMGHALLTCPMRLGLTRVAMPEHRCARPPTSPVFAFASASRGPPASCFPSGA